ncbi:DUF3772 domain-containing protein [Paragemmobacter straminiformis]|uniref:Mechanosensitive ion channel family protein n=1 Tax=Paragemmobacter straminiformis TaxID=2045119 RepID=A0A842IDP9_9RHOB|nr:DUF3772 domain-containing protein [Gemmobacter straminiformis]MBC2837367.1 mechanosensitive ion channel family protein [Gemmobacter straminiformis]
MTIGGALRRGLAGGLLALCLGLPAVAQMTVTKGAPSATPAPPASDPAAGEAIQNRPSIVAQKAPSGLVVSKGSVGSAALDYAAWEKAADRAETVLTDPAVTEEALDTLRAQLVDWRAAFLVSQNSNTSRVATLRDQIAALGPVPAEGETEVAEIAQRRVQLSEQLIRAQAPGIAAEEAYRRADGLIGEIDRNRRERQADQLLQLWPAPINPANWPAALAEMRDTAKALWTETSFRWRKGEGKRELFDNAPLIVVLTAMGIGFLWRGRMMVARLALAVPPRRTARGRRVVALAASVAQVLVPVIGLMALAHALRLTGMTGTLGATVLDALPLASFTVLAAHWLGMVVFPVDEQAETLIALPPERRAEGRFLTAVMGVVLGVEKLRQVIMLQRGAEPAAVAVWEFPVLVAVAVLLLRLGHLIGKHVKAEGEDAAGYSARVLGLIAKAAMLVGIVGPLLAAVGYIAAAGALVYPAAQSLGLVALLFVLQRLVADLYGLVTKSDAADQDGLLPVLIGFCMALASLPVFALVWGAQAADITELWQRFLGGFQLGETRVSPTDFLLFLVVFGAGYAVTRLMQGALKGTVLPRTSLDTGGQNAVVAGLGYLGIFLSALLAINFTGIDLSGLAIVAGALSVGIGFGLQNIVSNFVSGIILLIERPVSEGDWIEVGTVQGIVKSISVRSTRIQTFDRSDVIVPNTDLVAGRVTNWTRFNLSGRLVVAVTVAHGADSRKVERVLREIAEAQPLVMLNPPPVVALMGFNNDGQLFEIRMILRDVNFTVPVRSEVNHQIRERFIAEGIDLRPAPAEPVPLEVRMLKDDGAAAAAAPAPVARRRRVTEATDALPEAEGGATL